MTPSTIETITVSGRQYRTVKEGLAQILAPYQSSQTQVQRKGHNNDEGHQAVFYNPIQQFNRDLSVLAILIYGEGAVFEKELRSNRKQHGHKAKKDRGKAKPKSTDESGSSNKRKASELEDEIPEESAEPLKRQRTDDGTVEALSTEAEPQTISETVEKNTTNTDRQSTAPNHATDIQTTKPRQVAFTVLDALSATGLRALRYAKEIPFATNIVANDLLAEAVKSIELNIDHNNVRDRVHSNVADARAYMYSKIGNEHQDAKKGYVHRFDVIDLDPYGTAAPFLDSALQALQDGGLLCVTCTDAGVFASNGYPEKAYALYGGTTLKGSHSHEAGLRLILHAVATSAAKYGIAIEPLLSLSIDFYARLFIRVHKQQKDVKLLAGTTMMVYNCDSGCGAWKTQLLAKNTPQADKIGNLFFKHGYAQAPVATPNCEYCGTKTHLGGPMWAGLLHNPYFVQRILDRLPDLDISTYGTIERIRGMLTTALEEDLTLESSNTSPDTNKTKPLTTSKSDQRVIPRLPPEIIDGTPFFFIPNYLAKVLHCATPPEDPLRGAIRHLGYRVTRSHCKAGSFKTNAPWSVLWEIMREWVRTKAPIKEGAVRPNMPGWKILRGTRDSETKDVEDFKMEFHTRLTKCDSVDELKTILESAMWKINNGGIRKGIPEVNAKSGIENENENDPKQNGDGGHVNGRKSVEDGEAVVTTTTTSLPKQAESDKSDTLTSLNIIFDDRLGKEKPRGKLVRYQINPRANWGPMNRAGGAS